MLIVGLMSGTSLDGVDAALVSIEGGTVEDVRWRMVHWTTVAYDEPRREAIHGAIVNGSAEGLCVLHADLGEWLAEAVHRVCEGAGVPLDDAGAVTAYQVVTGLVAGDAAALRELREGTRLGAAAC